MVATTSAFQVTVTPPPTLFVANMTPQGVAASGVRLMIQLARQFEQHPEVRYGITTMCVGLGMGGTVVWENPHFTGNDQ